jgi:peptide-methionine (S)-S-oxide reductase
MATRISISFAAAVGLSLASSAPAQAPTETAVLAGGCFWGMEAVFEHVKGVRNVVSGYAGGSAHDASYDKVSSERTSHAEAIRISFNPRQVSYAQLLRIYFTVAHDPTQVNRQGPDVGPSYRSAIFPQSAAQRQIASSFIAQLRAAKKPIATKIESGPFYLAEAHHQDFVRRNPVHPYVVVHDRPKLAKLKRAYPQYWKA